MRARTRHTLLPFYIDLLACLLLPLFTLLLAGNGGWLETNFSVLAMTSPTRHRLYLLWGAVTGGYYLAVLGGISGTLTPLWQQLFLCTLTLSGCAALLGSLVLPYLPPVFPRQSRLHVVLAFSSCVLLMAAILAALLFCCREDPRGYLPLFLHWLGILALSGVLFALAGIISTALEVFFTLATLRLTRRLWLRRQSEIP